MPLPINGWAMSSLPPIIDVLGFISDDKFRSQYLATPAAVHDYRIAYDVYYVTKPFFALYNGQRVYFGPNDIVIATRQFVYCGIEAYFIVNTRTLLCGI